MGRQSWGLLPEVANNSATITKDTLPPMYSQLFDDGAQKRMFVNINDSITSLPLSDPAPFPTGIICMWSGTIATIPSGWYLCDGGNGTPDLRNRFIVCADADVSGVAKTTVTGVAAQSGDGQLPATVVNSSGAHTHDIGSGVYNTLGVAGSYFAGSTNTATSGSAGAHVHTFGTGTSNVAVYYALAFIMKK